MAVPGRPNYGFKQTRADGSGRGAGLNRAAQTTSARGVSKYFLQKGENGIIWYGWRGKYSKIIRALNRTATFNTIFARYIKQQDNIYIYPYIDKEDPTTFGQYMGVKPRGYEIGVGWNGFLIHDQLVADPTFVAKVIMHEGLHSRYDMATREGKLADYPTLNKHRKLQDFYRSNYKKYRISYEGDHQAMAEGNVGTLIQGMIQFDRAYGLQHSKDWYTAIAWWGSLSRSTSNWKNIPSKIKEKYARIQDNEDRYMGYLFAKAVYMNKSTKDNYQDVLSKKANVDWSLYRRTRTAG